MIEDSRLITGIHLDASDDDIEVLEKVLGVKFQRVEPAMIPAELIEVCPMEPSSDVGYLKYV